MKTYILLALSFFGFLASVFFVIADLSTLASMLFTCIAILSVICIFDVIDIESKI